MRQESTVVPATAVLMAKGANAAAPSASAADRAAPARWSTGVDVDQGRSVSAHSVEK